MKIYVASSWRNERQPDVVAALRAAGHSVYDFRNPVEGDKGFGWSSIDPDWQQWTATQQVATYEHPLAVKGFKLDFDAMKWADACVMVQPSGRSAALELGWAVGAGKKTVVLMSEGQEPELMLRLADSLCLTMDEVLAALAVPLASAAFIACTCGNHVISQDVQRPAWTPLVPSFEGHDMLVGPCACGATHQAGDIDVTLRADARRICKRCGRTTSDGETVLNDCKVGMHGDTLRSDHVWEELP